MTHDLCAFASNGDFSVTKQEQWQQQLDKHVLRDAYIDRDAKSEEHEERAPAIFPPAVLIFGLPTQKYAKLC